MMTITREDIQAYVAGSAVVCLMVLIGIVFNTILIALSPTDVNIAPWMSVG
jgi:hypothetical protein